MQFVAEPDAFIVRFIQLRPLWFSSLFAGLADPVIFDRLWPSSTVADEYESVA